MGESSDGSGLSRDLLLGKLALEKGWITSSQFRAVVAEVSSGRADSLPQYLVAHGYLPADKVAELLVLLEKGSTPSYPPFGKYTLLRELGRGAMGVVYEAEDSEGQKLALKLLIESPNRDPDEARVDRERFLREADLVRKMPKHPGLVSIHEAGVIDGQRYLAMELVDGLPFNAWRRRGSLNVRQQIAALRDAALAIHHVHQHGVVHRDLKPENILVDRQHRPRITDFGLAKAAGSTGQPALTASGSTLGTPAYMSPEQVQGLKNVDRRADIYALGVMLYEILTGRRPFEGASPYEIMMKTVNEPVIPPSRISNILLNPVLYRNLENICLIALAKDPGQRYPDAAALARDLTRWLRGEEFKVVVPQAWRRWRARNSLPRLALGVSVLLAVAAGALWWDARRQREDWGPALPAAAVDAAKLHPGAVLEYYAGLNRNALAFRRVDRRPHFDDLRQPAWSAHHGYWTSRRWAGYLDVPRTATYVFAMANGEIARVTIDGQDLVSGDSALPVTRTLEKGLHRLEIEHAHKGPDDTVRLSWNRQGESSMKPIGPADLLHEPAVLALIDPPTHPKRPITFVAGAEEGEKLTVLENSGKATSLQEFEKGHPFWKGSWSGAAHLGWGTGIQPGDRLKLRFSAGESGPATLALGLTLASDHGVFQILVNGREIASALDLFHDTDMRAQEFEFKAVPLLQGPNVLEFVATGSHPKAREWGGGSGIHKLGLDYVLVK